MKRLMKAMLLAVLIIGSSSTATWGIGISDVTVVEDQSIADKFIRYTVTGITTPLPQLPDVPGFIGASYLEMGDIDGDGVEEIICTSGVGLDGNATTADGAVAIFKSKGANAGSWTQAIINETFAFPNETLLRDMDDDGDLDIMVLDNFLAGWFSCGKAGIYYLENQGGDILSPANWVKRTIYQGEITGTCPCSPTACTDGIDSYHRAVFLDLDGDGLEDFVTTRVHMWYWQNTTQQYVWTEWFKKDGDDDPTAYLGPYPIGDGAGFLFNMADVDGDGNPDVIGPQFFIHDPGGLVVKGSPDGSDPRGDSLIWFENPGPAVLAANPNTPWNRYTIDNWYTSANPMGQGMEVIAADIDGDDVDELIFSNHNHQEYKPDTPPNNRIWPSGVYLLEIPGDPKVTANWAPVTIETGDPNLDPDDPDAVAADVYAVDRPGGPYSQGSPGMVRAADINDDGNMDLLVPGDGKGALYYYEGQGGVGTTLSFKRATLYKDPACMPGEADAADLDGDGHKDIVAVIFDTSVDKQTPYSSGSIFIFSADNCPTRPNGAALGTCVATKGGMLGSYRVGTPKEYITCTSDADCTPTGGTCQLEQGDCNGNGTGDVCECYANFNYPADLKVNASDLGILKQEYGRNDCSESNPCRADGNGDGKVNIQDFSLFKNEYGRQDCVH